MPPEISQLVQDFSGGAHFWVLEILQFLKDHGSEQFMSAIGEKSKSPNVTHMHPSIESSAYSTYGGKDPLLIFCINNTVYKYCIVSTEGSVITLCC